MSPSYTKDDWVEDIKFVLSECVRFANLINRTKPEELAKLIELEDWVAELPSSDGREPILCGAKAFGRLRELAMAAESQSDASGTINNDTVFQTLLRLVNQRFVVEGRTVDATQVERAMAAAVREAKRDRTDLTHYLPCRLTYSTESTAFSIGPVRFMSKLFFDKLMEPRISEFAAKNNSVYIDTNIANAKHYYSGFDWVGEVTVLNCDPKVSKLRAESAVTAALNILHILFGSYPTRKMAVGGARLKEDLRSHLSMNRNNHLSISWSQKATSAVGFEEGWTEILKRSDVQDFLTGATKTIEPLVNPSIKRPLALKFVDAAAWFGDAVREQSDSARIVKAVSGLERLVLSGEEEGIANLVCDRAAAIFCLERAPDKFEAIHNKAQKLYALRSKLVHGSISPFDPYVSSCAPACLAFTETVLSSALLLFLTNGLFDNPLSNAELSRGFQRMVDLAKSKARSSTAAQPGDD